MKDYDILPAALALPVSAVGDVLINQGAPALPGPTQSEWSGLIMAALALAVRELLWWFRNRKGSGSDADLPPSGG